LNDVGDVFIIIKWRRITWLWRSKRLLHFEPEDVEVYLEGIYEVYEAFRVWGFISGQYSIASTGYHVGDAVLTDFYFILFFHYFLDTEESRE